MNSKYIIYIYIYVKKALLINQENIFLFFLQPLHISRIRICRAVLTKDTNLFCSTFITHTQHILTHFFSPFSFFFKVLKISNLKFISYLFSFYFPL